MNLWILEIRTGWLQSHTWTSLDHTELLMPSQQVFVVCQFAYEQETFRLSVFDETITS